MNSPIEIFQENWQKAKSLDDANAQYCSLATVSKDGQASIRTLVLREVTNGSFLIFVNDTSSKWKDLLLAKQSELLVFWPSLMQQYRIRGEYSEVSAGAMKLHWAKKPYDSKILDHYYSQYQSQSSVVESRETMLNGIAELKSRYPIDKEVPFPDNAKGVAIQASYIEIWHGSASDRLHHRNLYLLSDETWEQQTLVP
ncbi:MAG: pyridoxine/pyridoxamine 5'-phosphate oxidase [Halioglobus sp.]|jgi:pyridoxine/pyridoxamine 5'-phosphate oxidase